MGLFDRRDELEIIELQNKKLMKELKECERKLASAEGDKDELEGEIERLYNEINIGSAQLKEERVRLQQSEQLKDGLLQEFQEMKNSVEECKEVRKQQAEEIEVLRETATSQQVKLVKNEEKFEQMIDEISKLRLAGCRQQKGVENLTRTSVEKIQMLTSKVTKQQEEIANLKKEMEKHKALDERIQELKEWLELSNTAANREKAHRMWQHHINLMMRLELADVKQQLSLMKQMVSTGFGRNEHHMIFVQMDDPELEGLAYQ